MWVTVLIMVIIISLWGGGAGLLRDFHGVRVGGMPGVGHLHGLPEALPRTAVQR